MRSKPTRLERWRKRIGQSRFVVGGTNYCRETNFPYAVGLLAVCASITVGWWWIQPQSVSNLWPEMGGMTLDVFFILIVFAWFEHRGEKRQDIARQREIIDDYKRWDQPEAHYRIAGAIRRLNRLGVFALHMAGARLSKFAFAEQGIEKIDGSMFFNGQWGERFGDSTVHMVEVDFDRISCRSVIFSPFNPLGGFGLSGSNYARFEDCSFNETDLSRAIFNGAELTWSESPPEEIGYAEDMGDGQWCWNQTHYGPFYLADLQQASFKDCWFKNADFRNVDNILEADFTGAKGLEDAFFDNDEIRVAVLAQAVGRPAPATQ
ncbi:pentapeptide repeat-containing protein [Novosphingobium umbonatum]|uniref:Pentapeptide repeat-containing protein n=1 Tax=Novosphingobium umbonatum TaxID=1908524 RepID=A0A437N2F2_9SPHN|nr:pentapeptide repeat-containing protein [Novosphingobium umbonatum]RVU04048.1 pentapeptide repeat-containing protein [Novosphingobium umbonatum]